LSEPAPPSTLFLENLERLRSAAAARPVLDLACGRGRHALAVAEAGLRSCAVDRDRESVRLLTEAAAARGERVECIRADLEADPNPPFQNGSCGGILVFRFLFRPLAPRIETLLAPGGLLLYETFTVAQREFVGGPRRAAFLLEPGELRDLFPGLETIAYWEGVTAGPRPAALARLVARRAP
jgi:SAM-dependent methyltransferase